MNTHAPLFMNAQAPMTCVSHLHKLTQRLVRCLTRSSALLGALLAIGLLTQGVAAQNTREQPSRSFVEESRAIRSGWEGLVRNERVNPEWLASGRVIYRLDEAGDAWRFVICDAETKEVAPAFDHGAVASGLSRELGTEISAGTLPFTRFALDGDDLVAMLDQETATKGSAASFRISLSDGAVSIPEHTPEAFRARVVDWRESGSGPATYLVVKNTTDRPVKLVWLNNDGNPRPYETVAPKTTAIRTTFSGHIWSLRSNGDELTRVVGERRPTIVDLGLPVESGDEPAEDEETDREHPESAKDQPETKTPVRVELRSGDIYLIGNDGERRLTTDGREDFGFEGDIWMSPDRTKFAVMRVLRAPVRTIHFVESSPDDQVQPRLHEMEYTKPGDPLDELEPWIFDVESGAGMPVSDDLIPMPWSLTRVHWHDDNSLRMLYNQRGHSVVRLVEFDATSGEGRTVVEEASETFVDYPYKIYHRRLGSDKLLWTSQRTGWNHLYLLDSDSGAVIRPLTSGEWLVRSIEDIDEEAGTVLLRVRGFHEGQDPYHSHFVRVEFDTGKMTVLTDGDGTHSIERSPDGAFYTARYSRVDLPPVSELRRWSDGSLVSVLAEADASDLLAKGWVAPERFVAKGRDGKTDIWGVIFRPTDFNPDLDYAVIEYIYAGPHNHFTPKSWSTWHSQREVAERGFIVVQMDGMGTNWRSKAFHDVAHKNLGDSGFPDRKAWIREAALTRPFMDLSRVGIYGGSAGGQSSTRALLMHGDFYHAAVSDCGCHDNRVDKIWWNELWMGYPIGPHYAEHSSVTHAKNLQGDLLLIVGEMDRNVDPASTMQVVNALIEADKDFELLVIPGAGHGAAESPYGRRRRAEFFGRVLGGPVERAQN